VAREVREESGAVVTQVDILGSQPWPIGELFLVVGLWMYPSGG
jgi:NADH pyrophosphatase NudC (nudix superfamily)